MREEQRSGVKGRGSGVDVCGQLEVLEGVEGDVAAVDHGEDHRDVAALGGQQLDGPQVRNRALETGRGAQVKVKVKVKVEFIRQKETQHPNCIPKRKLFQSDLVKVKERRCSCSLTGG